MMNIFKQISLAALISIAFIACDKTEDPIEPPVPTIDQNFDLKSTSAIYNDELEYIELSMSVVGEAGATLPTAVGSLDGAPVLGYVFPTSLAANDVGFGDAEGIVAMALTSHPDFDDTPLWDENTDGDYLNDGVEWHSHWVILQNDDRVEGGLSVLQFEMGDESVELPKTNPGMPMYMDSPGYQVITQGSDITVVIPTAFTNGRSDFNYDAVSARLTVNTSNPDLPMLGVYEVYEVLSGDLSLPYTIN